MAYEEDVLALLKKGADDAAVTEQIRQDRYKMEDAARIVERQREDHLRDQGTAVRVAKQAEVEAAIAARGQTPESQIADQNARIAKLEKMLQAVSDAPVPPVAPAPPVA